MPDHGIQDGQELAHACGESQRPGGAGRRRQSPGCIGWRPGWPCRGMPATWLGRPTPCVYHGGCPVSGIEGCYSHQSSDLLAVKYAQLRQPGQKGQGSPWADPGHTAQQIVLLPPVGALADAIPQLSIQLGQFLFQSRDVALDAPRHQGMGSMQTVLLRGEHAHYLPPAGHPGRSRPGIRHRAKDALWAAP
jgi:hypothetical protein